MKMSQLQSKFSTPGTLALRAMQTRGRGRAVCQCDPKFLGSPNVERIEGTYRGAEVIIYVDPASQWL